MSKKKEKEEVQEQPALDENLVEISLQNLLAAIVKHIGVVVVPIENALDSYENYSIAMSLDDETRMLILELVENDKISNDEMIGKEVKDGS